MPARPKKSATIARHAREAAALRENLRKRKDQAGRRAEGVGPRAEVPKSPPAPQRT